MPGFAPVPADPPLPSPAAPPAPPVVVLVVAVVLPAAPLEPAVDVVVPTVDEEHRSVRADPPETSKSIAHPVIGFFSMAAPSGEWLWLGRGINVTGRSPSDNPSGAPSSIASALSSVSWTATRPVRSRWPS